METKQYYLPGTNVLVTRFLTDEGVGEVTDFMPVEYSMVKTKHHRLLRLVGVIRGAMMFDVMHRPAFNYAQDKHRVEVSKRGAIFRDRDLVIGLSSSIPLEEDEGWLGRPRESASVSRKWRHRV